MIARVVIAVVQCPRQSPDDFFFLVDQTLGRLCDLGREPVCAVRQVALLLAKDQKVAHTRLELDGIDRLVEEIGGARADRVETRLPVVVGGDHHDRDMGVGRLFADLRDEGAAVHRRHHVVDEEQVEELLGGSCERFQRIEEGLDFAIRECFRRSLFKTSRFIQVVLDNEYAHQCSPDALLRLTSGNSTINFPLRM